MAVEDYSHNNSLPPMMTRHRIITKVISSGFSHFISDFKKHSPARATFQVGKLPLGADVEIEAIALSGDLEIKEGAGDSCSQPDPCSRKC